MSISEYFKKHRSIDNDKAVYADTHYPRMTIPVRLSSLQATQDNFDQKRLESVSQLESTEPIHLWKDSRGYRVIDGHHRAIAAMQRGDKTIVAHVFMSPDSPIQGMMGG
jgi:hypothetical protein